MTPYSFIYRRKKSRKLAVIAVLAAVFAGALYMFLANLKEAPERSAVKEEAVSEERVPLNEWVEPDPDFGKDMPQYEVDEWPTIPIPPAPDMARMKAQMPMNTSMKTFTVVVVISIPVILIGSGVFRRVWPVSLCGVPKYAIQQIVASRVYSLEFRQHAFPGIIKSFAPERH